jgi:protein involved in polysaccharide export with SLBB domain
MEFLFKAYALDALISGNPRWLMPGPPADSCRLKVGDKLEVKFPSGKAVTFPILSLRLLGYPENGTPFPVQPGLHYVPEVPKGIDFTGIEMGADVFLVR